jgi:hypothetical protein
MVPGRVTKPVLHGWATGSSSVGGGVHVILAALVRRFYDHDSLLFLPLFKRIEKFALLFFPFFVLSLLFSAFREGDGLIIQSAGRHDAGFGSSELLTHRLGTVMLGVFVRRGASRSTGPATGGKRYAIGLDYQTIA